MTAKQQNALTTLLQTGVSVAAVFIPGLDLAVQGLVLAFGTAAIAALIAFLPEPKP